MGINPHSVVGFLLREAGYAEADVAKILGITQEYGPAVTSVIESATQVIQTDVAAFQAHQTVESPPVDASIEGGAYAITVVFTPK